MATSAGFKVLYEHDGVFIHTNPERSEEQDSLTSGFLRVLDQDGDIVLEYKPMEDVDHSAMLCAAKVRLHLHIFRFNIPCFRSS
eukprot:XP_014043453.1 PREDICTED: TBC1 domain family member 15-like [Salmo salar]